MREFFKTHGHEGRESITNTLDVMILTYIEKYKQIDYIGISTAGNIDPVEGLCVYASDNLKGWTGFRIKDYIFNKFNIPTFVENDAVCHLYSQLNKNNINKTIFLMTIGTGLGAVVFKNKQICYGKDFDLMAIAHNIVEPCGIRCDCGKLGCAEKELSATGLSIRARLRYNQNINIKELFNKYKQKDEIAIEIIDAYFVRFNYFIKLIEKNYNPDLILIGGGVARAKDVFENNIVSNTKISFLKHSGNAGVYGAYNLVRMNIYGII